MPLPHSTKSDRLAVRSVRPWPRYAEIAAIWRATVMQTAARGRSGRAFARDRRGLHPCQSADSCSRYRQNRPLLRSLQRGSDCATVRRLRSRRSHHPRTTPMVCPNSPPRSAPSRCAIAFATIAALHVGAADRIRLLEGLLVLRRPLRGGRPGDRPRQRRRHQAERPGAGRGGPRRRDADGVAGSQARAAHHLSRRHHPGHAGGREEEARRQRRTSSGGSRSCATSC